MPVLKNTKWCECHLQAARVPTSFAQRRARLPLPTSLTSSAPRRRARAPPFSPTRLGAAWWGKPAAHVSPAAPRSTPSAITAALMPLRIRYPQPGRPASWFARLATQTTAETTVETTVETKMARVEGSAARPALRATSLARAPPAVRLRPARVRARLRARVILYPPDSHDCGHVAT